ncbi:MAG: hypothetical protein RIR19_664 [Chloroflexota bacterium]|jgi:hypothetical protein
MSDQPSAELTTLRLDAQNGILEVGGRTVHLTSVERRLVALLYSRLGDSLTHREIRTEVTRHFAWRSIACARRSNQISADRRCYSAFAASDTDSSARASR